jgi:hypothetical protein
MAPHMRNGAAACRIVPDGLCLGSKLPGGHTVQPNAALRVIDFRTSRIEQYERSAVSDDVVARLEPVLQADHVNGDIDPRWHIEIKGEHRFPAYSLPGLPGTAYGGQVNTATSYPQVVGGVRFTLSAKSRAGEPCLIGWLAWCKSVGNDVWGDAIATLRQNATELGDLCPSREPETPNGLPWLAVLCMPPWRRLSRDELIELKQLMAPVGWSAIRVLSRKTD